MIKVTSMELLPPYWSISHCNSSWRTRQQNVVRLTWYTQGGYQPQTARDDSLQHLMVDQEAPLQP
jgi:hypothetical protein